MNLSNICLQANSYKVNHVAKDGVKLTMMQILVGSCETNTALTAVLFIWGPQL